MSNLRYTQVLNESAYPLYKRTDDGHVVIKNDIPMDNRDVIPYNPCLSKRYDAHINVEVVSSVKAVKYLYKYTYKGHDRADLEVVVDEIQNHVNSRYVGPAEACWRLFQFPLTGKSHVVCRLALHLEHEQLIYFEEGAETEAVTAAEHKHTTLTAWFALNAKDPDARQFTYQQIPEFYRWDRKTTTWIPRSKVGWGEKIIGRIHSANPVEQDRFYLYLLLLHVKGPRSWASFKTVNGKEVATWREVAEHHNLIDTDNECKMAMQEANACSDVEYSLQKQCSFLYIPHTATHTRSAVLNINTAGSNLQDAVTTPCVFRSFAVNLHCQEPHGTMGRLCPHNVGRFFLQQTRLARCHQQSIAAHTRYSLPQRQRHSRDVWPPRT